MYESTATAYTILVEGLERNRALARLTRRWKDHIKNIFKNWVCEYELDSFGSGQEPVAVFPEHGNDRLVERLSTCGVEHEQNKNPAAVHIQ
jgi:hypothetical protein